MREKRRNSCPRNGAIKSVVWKRNLQKLGFEHHISCQSNTDVSPPSLLFSSLPSFPPPPSYPPPPAQGLLCFWQLPLTIINVSANFCENWHIWQLKCHMPYRIFFGHFPHLYNHWVQYKSGSLLIHSFPFLPPIHSILCFFPPLFPVFFLAIHHKDVQHAEQGLKSDVNLKVNVGTITILELLFYALVMFGFFYITLPWIRISVIIRRSSLSHYNQYT